MATITVEIPDAALERIRRAAAKRGVTADEYIRDAVAGLAPGPPVPAAEPSAEERGRAFREFLAAVKPTPPGVVVDDSRDSIY